MKPSVLRSATVLAAILFAGSMLASAQSAGYDLLQTGSGASVDLSSVPGISPTTVPLKGVPICACIGNTDTIMHRTQDVPAGGGTVSVNVYALSMKNSGNVSLNGQPIDVYITINNTGGDIATSALAQPDALTESTGTVTVRTDGTFDSNIAVHADVIFTMVGGNPASSSQVVGHSAAPQITLTSSGSTWSSTPTPGYPSAPCYPSGGFYPKPVHTGPHPVVPPGPTPTPTPSPSPTPSVTPSPTPFPSPSPSPSVTPTRTPFNPNSNSTVQATPPADLPQVDTQSIFVWTTNRITAQAGFTDKRAAVVLSASALSPTARSQRTCPARSQQPARPVPVANVAPSKESLGMVINRDWVPAVAP